MRELYARGARDPSEISRRIVAALSPDVVAQMAGPGVATCLDALLQAAVLGPDLLAEGAGLPGGHSTAATVRAAAERRIATEGWASRFSDIALDALGTCLVGAPAADAGLGPALSSSCGPAERVGPSPDARLLSRFMRSDMERCFGYFVSRDISEFVGLPALPDVAAADAAVRRVCERCGIVVGSVDFGPVDDILPRHARPPGEWRVERLLSPLERMVRAGLEAVGGHPADQP